jgi:hypothetical protein
LRTPIKETDEPSPRSLFFRGAMDNGLTPGSGFVAWV